ncbi:MAG: hypothetical protein ABI999_11890 [Acidobacteriota bacterium]
MRKSIYTIIGGLVGFCFILIVIGSYVIVAQTALTGDWRADSVKQKDGKIYVSFERRTARGGHDQNGSNYDYSDFDGLTREQAANGKVSFRLVREAGTIDCQGTFVDGKGSGTFTFTSNRSFIDAMKSRGFDFEKSGSKHEDDMADRLFAAATINVTTRLADDLLSTNFGPLDVEDLFKAAIFHVDSQFMAEMKATGFTDLKMEDLVKARIFKIDADYVRQMHDAGFDKESFEGLVKFRIFKITPEFLNDLKAEGFSGLSSEEVVKFRIFNIDTDFIRKAKADDPNVTVEDLVQMKIGVRRAGK